MLLKNRVLESAWDSEEYRRAIGKAQSFRAGVGFRLQFQENTQMLSMPAAFALLSPKEQRYSPQPKACRHLSSATHNHTTINVSQNALGWKGS